jgi:hypothetical protein
MLNHKYLNRFNIIITVVSITVMVLLYFLVFPYFQTKIQDNSNLQNTTISKNILNSVDEIKKSWLSNITNSSYLQAISAWEFKKCETLKEWLKESCYLSYINSLKITECNSFPNDMIQLCKNKIIYKNAITENKLILCNGITDSSLKTNCYLEIENNFNLGMCSMLPWWERDSCINRKIIDTSETTLDISVCYKIEDKILSEQCRQSVINKTTALKNKAINQNDIIFKIASEQKSQIMCMKITDSRLKENCLSNLSIK